MRISRKRLLRWGLGSSIAIALFAAAVWTWLVPWAIVAAVRAHYGGHVAIKGWWVNGSSAGVTGLVLREAPGPSSPILASVDRVAIDLGLRALLRGRFAPRRVEVQRPDIAFRLQKDGQPLTRVPLIGGGASGAVPAVFVRDGRLTIQQEGRPEMVVRHLACQLAPVPSGPTFHIKADDPEWGGPTIDGNFSPDFGSFSFQLNVEKLAVDRSKTARVPFVDPNIFHFVAPSGTIGARVDYASPKGPKDAPRIVTSLRFEGTRVALPSLDLVGEEAFGSVVVQDGIVKLRDARGRMSGGRVAVTGTLDFTKEPYRHELAVALDGVDLSALPRSWGLEATGVRGRASGAADLKMTLLPEGIDATGTSGWGRVEGAVIEGAPVNDIRLKLSAVGLRHLASAPPAQGPFLPQWLDVEIEAPDIDLAPAVGAVSKTSPHENENTNADGDGKSSSGSDAGLAEGPMVSGRLAVRASVHAPLGAFDDLSAYTLQGSADWKGGAVRGRVFGPLTARFTMDQGAFELTDARGSIAGLDRETPRADGAKGRVEGSPRFPPAVGPMLPGDVRGLARVVLTGDDRPIEARIEGAELPLRELAKLVGQEEAAAVIDGAITIGARARSRWSEMGGPRGWSLSGRAAIAKGAYEQTTVHDLSTSIEMDKGRLAFPDLMAHVADLPLAGRLAVDLAAPWGYEAAIEADGLALGELLAMAPHAPSGLSVSGQLSGKAEASGTFEPWELRSEGQARVTGLETERIDWGDVPFHWKAQGENILVSAEDVQHYGGTMRIDARLPVRADRPIEGTFVLKNVDSAELSDDMPGNWRMKGRADGHGWFRVVPGRGDSRQPEVSAEAELSAPDLKLHGVSARTVELTLGVRDGVPRLDAAAKMLGGTVRVAGSTRSDPELREDALQARVEARGLELFEIWRAVGLTGGLADLRGQARAIVHSRSRANLSDSNGLKDVQVNGTAELERLAWGRGFVLGRIRAPFLASADRWSVGPLGGELWGSPLRGDGVFMNQNRAGAAEFGIDLRLDHILLRRGLAFLPAVAERVEGPGRLHIRGRSQNDFRGQAEFRVDRALVNQLELTRFRAPAHWVFSREAPHRGMLTIRNAGGSLAGGRIGGSARIALGVHRDFKATLEVEDVDLRVISRDAMANRPVVGRLTGFIDLEGPDPLRPEDYRGELDFDLVHASLLDVPLLDSLDRTLGSAQGGVFNAGDLHGTIAGRKVLIDNLTLVGPLAQVHASGWLDFEGRMNIEAVVNTTRAIPEAGQMLLARGPRVAEAVASRAARIDQVADAISARLMKFRITGTLDAPVVNADSSINGRAAIGFFIRTFSLSLQSRGRP